MLSLRLREYTPTGVRGKVLPHAKGSLSVTVQENGTPVLRFALSTRVSGRMPDDGFVVSVEYSVGGGRFVPLPEHDRFVVSEDSGDDADQSKTVTYSGESYVSWLLARTYLHWSQYAKNGARLWTESGHPASPGTIVGGMVLESKARGWGDQVEMDFAWDTDSNGVPWQADDKVLQEWRLLTPLTEVLTSLVKSGLCDWTVEGMKLRLFRPGTHGADRAELVLGGPRMEHVPVKTDASKIFTHLTVVPEKAYYWLYLDNVGAPSKWGRLEATMTQSGIDNHTEATKLAQPALLEGRSAKREESFEWTPSDGDLVPWRDFQVGDTLTARVRGAQLPRRVIGIVAREQGEAVSVRVIVGEKIGTVQSRILARVGAGSVGGIIGGSGNSFPGSIGPSALAPDRPNALHVKANTGEWGEGGSSRSTVTLEWEPVTAAVDGSLVDIVEYEIWSRLPSEQPSLVTTVAAAADPEASITLWAPGVERLAAVRAKSAQGIYGDWSLEVLFTPASPSSVVPKAPQNVRVLSNIGAFTAAGPIASVLIGWDAVTQSTDEEPLTVAEYELWADGPIARVTATSMRVNLPSGLLEEYRVRARAENGAWGDLSTVLEVTGASPSVGAFAPTAPILKTGYGDVIAKWDGTYTAPAAGAHTVWIEARIGADLWQRQGMVLTAAGEALITLGDVGDIVEVRAVSYDQLGRETGISEVASIEVASIPGAAITAGSIFVDRLAPNVGETLNIGGNAVAINLNSRVDNALVDIEQVQQDADAAQSSADAAAAAADAANQAVETLAAGRVLTAEAALAVLSGKIDTYENSFLFLPDGLHIRESTSAKAEMVLTSAGARLVADGVAVSEWNQGQLLVAQIVAKSGQIANHIIDSSVAGHTTWRAIS